MSQSVANWTAFLLSRAGTGAAREVRDTPTTRVLAALKGTRLMPLTELPEATRLAPDEALAAIERLRKLQQVEVVERGEGSGIRYLRLTHEGYAALTDLER